MAPIRRAKAPKRYSNSSDTSPVGKNKQGKRKHSEELGPKWSKRELRLFYEAYHKYGQNWKKVAAVVRNRNTEMVEALYNMNRESYAFLNLRHRNAYPGNSLPPALKYSTNFTVHGSIPSSFNISSSQRSGSSVGEIVEISRLKAQKLVNAAVQAMSSRKEGEEASVRVRRALDYINIQSLTSDYKSALNRTQDHVNGTPGHLNQLICGAPEPTTSDSSPISEVITQTCTERRYHPYVVAQVLDHAVENLHPRCPQNVGMYREIQSCMGRIKTQILALVPT